VLGQNQWTECSSEELLSVQENGKDFYVHLEAREATSSVSEQFSWVLLICSRTPNLAHR
ncbi:hypothetical protein IGI04_014663, partial [Brassica rapa subsp. trilocularis]